jgi:uncharacterized membrane protein YsdA (DUF1294 family)
MKARRGIGVLGSTSLALRALQYLLSGLLLSLTGALILQGAFGLGLIVAWLITINLFAFIFYRLDKINSLWAGEDPAQAAQNVQIPEAALLLLALAGGSPAAAVALVLPPRTRNHRSGFVYAFVLMLVCEVIAILALRNRIPWS